MLKRNILFLLLICISFFGIKIDNKNEMYDCVFNITMTVEYQSTLPSPGCEIAYLYFQGEDCSINGYGTYVQYRRLDVEDTSRKDFSVGQNPINVLTDQRVGGPGTYLHVGVGRYEIIAQCVYQPRTQPAKFSLEVGSDEVCDGIDNDCDGDVDEGPLDSYKYFYKDADDDDYGHPTDRKWLCRENPPYDETNNNDCNDDDPSVQICHNWYDKLPACPCENPDKNGIDTTDIWEKDSKYTIGFFHPGANECFRSFPPIQTEEGMSRQQCCYDNHGKLITWGSGAGTPDKESGVVHQTEDVIPWLTLYAWIKKEGVNQVVEPWIGYNLIWVPNNGNNCVENPRRR